MTHTSTEQELQKLREELAEETEAAENWRRLALQFDKCATRHGACVYRFGQAASIPSTCAAQS